MSDTVNQTKARSIVLDSLKSTEINAGTQIYLNSSQVVVNGTLKRSFQDQSVSQFGNSQLAKVTLDTPRNRTLGPNIEITEQEILNGLIVINNGTLDAIQGAEGDPGAGAVAAGEFGNICLPDISSLQSINVNQSVDFSLINNYYGRLVTGGGDVTTPFKIEDNISSRGYYVIGHPTVYSGTSASFRLFRNNISNYNVYRLS